MNSLGIKRVNFLNTSLHAVKCSNEELSKHIQKHTDCQLPLHRLTVNKHWIYSRENKLFSLYSRFRGFKSAPLLTSQFLSCVILSLSVFISPPPLFSNTADGKWWTDAWWEGQSPICCLMQYWSPFPREWKMTLSIQVPLTINTNKNSH